MRRSQMACKGTFLLIVPLAAEGKIEFNPEEANRRVVIISALGGIALAQALA
jgi:hypothetical protein